MCAPVRPGHDRAKRCGPARQEEQSAEVEHGEQQPADPVGLTFARHDETGAATATATDLCARQYAQATTAPSDAVPLARKNSPRKSNTGSSSPPTRSDSRLLVTTRLEPRPLPRLTYARAGMPRPRLRQAMPCRSPGR